MSRWFAVVVLLTSVSAHAITRSWTGATSANWSDPTNWSPSGTPTATDALVFPSSASNATMNNDLVAGSVGSMTFNAAYVLNGNALTVSGDVVTGSISFTCNTALTIAAPLALGGTYNGAIDVNGQTLTLGGAGMTVHALNGTGAVIVNSQGAYIASSGAFSGTITGPFDLTGSLPNATVTAEHLSGVGTLGSVNAGSGSGVAIPSGLSPGNSNILSGESHTIGTLQTGSLTIDQRYLVDLVPAGTSDLVKVTGTVTLHNSPTLTVNVTSGAPAAGQTFEIIDNDGSDPVVGTFNGMPEGSSFTVGTATFVISYHGGDGNDVVLTTTNSPKSWTGAASALWSNPSNWSPSGVPIATDDLVFPNGAANTAMTNDLPAGTSIGPMTFNAAYSLSGNALTLTGDVVAGATFTCNVDLTAGTSIHLGGVAYNGAINVNGHTLTLDTPFMTVHALNGSGAIVINSQGANLDGSGNFSGTISGPFDLTGSLPNATVTAEHLSGVGTLGPVSAGVGAGVAIPVGLSPGNSNLVIGEGHTIGTLQTGSLTIANRLLIDLVPGAASDLVKVTGSVSIAIGTTLVVNVTGNAPSAGQSFTIIDNDGSDPVVGTFSGMLEGTMFAVGPWSFVISYRGGDGNDVVLTRIASSSTALAQNPDTTKAGESVTFTATLTSESGIPDGGTVSFMDGTTTLGTAAVHSGTATFATSVLAGGTHTIIATYGGTNSWAASTSNPVTHTVTHGPSRVTATVAPSPSYAGMPFTVTVHVTDQGPLPGPLATGTVTVSWNHRAIATQPLVNGTAVVDVRNLPVGDDTLDVSYSGDVSYDPSSASVHQQVLPPAVRAADMTTNGDAAHAIAIPVTLSAALAVPVSVSYATADDTATAGTNYASASGTLTFAPGQLTAAIAIDILGNKAAGPLSFRLNLSNATNASIATPSATITINGNAKPTTYEYAPGLTLDFYPPANPKNASPVILAIPGTFAYDSAADPIPALRETLRGYAVARVAYRSAPYPAPLDDLIAALAWIRGNAATLNIDPNRIGAWGFGAGAHLAMLLGANNHLQAVIDCSGATDLPHLDADALACSTIVHNAASSPESQFLGCTIAVCPSEALIASPVANVGSDTAATLILHGDADCTIAPVQALRMYDALRSHDIHTALFLVHGMGHDEVWNATGMPAEIDSFLDVHLKNLGARPRPSR